MEQSREIASIANCMFCNAHFVVVLSAISINEGEGVNAQLLQDRLEGICRKLLTQQPFELIRCPACTEIITGMSFADWLYSDISPVFTLCVFEHFNSPATLYVNTSPNILNPQWQLILGNGPKELVLKDTQSGLLHSNTFNTWGAFNPTNYNPQHRSKRDHLYIIDTVHQAVRNNANATQFVAQLHPHRPLFINWEHVANHVEATSIDLSFMKI
jgi:hypothetical protein